MVVDAFSAGEPNATRVDARNAHVDYLAHGLWTCCPVGLEYLQTSRARRWWAIGRDAAFLWLDRNAFSHAGALVFYTLFSLAPVFNIAVAVIGVVFGEEAAHGAMART